MKKLAIPAVILASAAAALAQAPTASPETAPAPVETQQTGLNNDPNERVCVRERETGSLTSTRRVCRTRAEWATYREQTRQVLERVQMNKQTSGQ